MVGIRLWNSDAILSREIAAGNIAGSAVFLGDSTYDHRAAAGAGLDFVFVSGWSEVRNWPDYVRENRLPVVPALAALADPDKAAGTGGTA